MLETAIRERIDQDPPSTAATSIFERIKRATLKATCIEVTANISDSARTTSATQFEIPWMPKAKPDVSGVELTTIGKPDHKLVQSVVRAHAWLRKLSNGTHASIESLAAAVNVHPKVIRQALRLAFLDPATIGSILEGSQSAQLTLASIPFTLPLSWDRQNRALESAC